MRRAFFGRAPALVVNLGGRDVAVTEQFLHLPNSDAGIEEQGSGGRPQGMRAVEPRTFLDRPRQLCHVADNDSVHAGFAHGLVTSSSLWARRARKRGPASIPAFLRYSEIASAAAKWMPMVRWRLPFSLNGESCLVAVLVEVLNPHPAGGSKPYAGVEIGFEDGAIAEIEHIVAGGKSRLIMDDDDGRIMFQ
jgi:hypothetical protein